METGYENFQAAGRAGEVVLSASSIYTNISIFQFGWFFEKYKFQ